MEVFKDMEISNTETKLMVAEICRNIMLKLPIEIETLNLEVNHQMYKWEGL
jgi:hypothetical protein